MSEGQNATQNKTPGLTPREFDIELWHDLLNFADHILYELEEEGCLEEKDKEYYEAIKEALYCVYREYFVKGNEEQEKVFKVALIEALESFVNRLFFCI
jgi:hypothetical protein